MTGMELETSPVADHMKKAIPLLQQIHGPNSKLLLISFDNS